MTDQTPPPLPNEKQCCSTTMLPFLAGLLIGGGVVAAGGFVYVRQERAKAERALAEAAMQQAGQFMHDAVGGAMPLPFGGPGKANAPATEADKVKALGDETVDDFRQGRLLAVYRTTTKEFQGRTKMEDLEKTVKELPGIRGIFASHLREAKVRKAAAGDGYEYYCTAPGSYAGVINFAFTFVPVDSGWRIDDIQVK